MLTFFVSSPTQTLSGIQYTEVTGCPIANVYQDTIVPLGGQAPYSYHWDLFPMQFTQSVQVSSVGSFQLVHITDATSCTHSQYINYPNGFLSTITYTPNFCNSGYTATCTHQGGVPPYTYNWSTIPPSHSNTVSNLSAGTYSCIVRDANWCASVVSVVLPVLPNLLSSIQGYQVTNCDTGDIWVQATQGQAPYTYQWNTNPPVFSDTLHHIPHGTYTCYIADANNCQDTQVVVYNATWLTITPQFVPGVCNQNIAWVTVQNGQMPYSYTWNTNPPTLSDTARNLLPGTYQCVVSDALNCIDSTMVLVVPANPLQLQDSAISSVCSNGKAWVTPLNGIAPFTFQWNTQPPEFTDTIRNLSPGFYKCIVTDASGCADSTIATVFNGTTTISQSVVHPICMQPNNGRASLIVNGSNPPFTYSWNTNPIQTTATATGLSQGIYLFTVRDVSGCVFTGASTLVFSNPAISSLVQNLIPERCFLANGSATVSFSSLQAPGPYTITWNTTPVQIGNTATGLVAGNYTATAANSFGCLGIQNITIPLSMQYLTSQAQVQHATCTQQNGNATILPITGTPPYTWQWNLQPIQTTQTVTGLAPGNYLFQFTDQTGCSGSGTAIVQQNIQVITGNVSQLSGANCPNYTNGALQCNISGGGVPPYTYLWSNGQTTQSIGNLSPVLYSVIVTDALGCTGNFSRTVSGINTLASSFVSTPPHCLQSDGQINFMVGGGSPPYSYLWNLFPSPNSPTVTNLPHGTYQVTVTDALGCTHTRNIPLPQVSCGSVIISGRVLNDLNGNGQEDPGEPGMAGRQVTLSNPLTTTFTNSQGYYTFPAVPTGTYTITTPTPSGFIQTYPAQNNSLSLQAFTPNLNYYFNDFRFNAGSPFQDIRVTSGNYTPARRGFPFQQLVKVQNAGNTVVSPWLNVTYPNHLLYTNSSYPPLNHTLSLKTLNYQMPSLQPMTDTLVQVNFITDIAAPIGQTVYFQNQAGPLVGDVNLTNNAMNSGVVLTGPYDPNDNMLIPDYVYGKIGLLGMMDSVLTYRIRFQNNGNDTAFNVLVVDTLDPALKRETMEVLMSSHYVETTIDSSGKISFYFPNIMLPDSTTDEEGSKGAVFFRITGKVQIGYTVKNTAHIYFDFNEAIVTNTSEYTWLPLEISRAEEIEGAEIICYPNPSNGNWYIISAETGEWELCSISGTIVRKGMLSSESETEIIGEDMSNGMYLIRVKTESGVKLKKVVKW